MGQGFFGNFISLLVLFAITYQAYAYKWSGCKWSTNNPVYDGHTLTSGWNNAVSNGRNQWNNVTPSPLYILRNDSSNNDVTPGATGGKAATIARTCSSGTITDADIVFNSSFTWYTGTGSPGSSWDAWSVATHEFGHHIGFKHTQAELCGGSQSTRPTMCSGNSAGTTYKRSLEYSPIELTTTSDGVASCFDIGNRTIVTLMGMYDNAYLVKKDDGLYYPAEGASNRQEPLSLDSLIQNISK